MRYPEVLDYYFSLVDMNAPADDDPSVLNPKFGTPVKEPAVLSQRRRSIETNGATTRRKEKRHSSRGRTPPPPAPSPRPRRREKF